MDFKLTDSLQISEPSPVNVNRFSEGCAVVWLLKCLFWKQTMSQSYSFFIFIHKIGKRQGLNKTHISHEWAEISYKILNSVKGKGIEKTL